VRRIINKEMGEKLENVSSVENAFSTSIPHLKMEVP
jgi:hypothetical protein